MAKSAGPLSERMRLLNEFIEQGLAHNVRRKQSLGLADDALLDPEEPIDQQIVILRDLFLTAEQTALPFDPRDANFWQILRARLQPIVLAYLTHERFVQTLDKEQLALRPDALTEVYRDRLDNSDRFRQFFFELTERLEKAAPDAIPAIHANLNQYKTADDTAQIQGNVLKSLEKQLRDREQQYSQQEILLNKANEEILYLKDTLHEKNDDIGRLRRQVLQLEEELVHHKLSQDAAARQQRGQNSTAAPELLSEGTETEQLQMRIMTLEKELAVASDSAYDAFMSSSDLGIVILFMLSSFNCDTVERLAHDMSRSVSTFGLKTVVGVRKGSGYHYVASTGADLQLKSLLELHRGKGKQVDANHLMLYQPGCCLLIQDPTRTDMNRYERIKNNVGTLLKGAEARLEAIEAAQAVQRQKNQVEQLILRSYDVLQGLDKNVLRQQERLSRLINTLTQDMRRNLGIAPGDQKSIRLSMDLKKMEDALREVFRIQELVDPAFAKNISKVAQGILTRQKGGDA